MYQLSMSINKDYADWFYEAQDKLKQDLNGHALMVTREEPNRLYIAFASENQHKKKVSSIIYDFLYDIYSIKAKKHFYKENLTLPSLSTEKYNILLTALVEFDSRSDIDLIKETVVLENGLNIDGVYNFKFNHIKSRWKEIGDLTKENAFYLNDNEIFFELIRYLFSAIIPKTNTISLIYDGQKYTLIDGENKQLIKEVFSEEDLLCSLISIAPIGLELKGERFNKSIFEKLNVIFGVNDKKLSLSEHN